MSPIYMLILIHRMTPN